MSCCSLSLYAVEKRKVGIIDQQVNTFVCKDLFSTLRKDDFVYYGIFYYKPDVGDTVSVHTLHF